MDLSNMSLKEKMVKLKELSDLMLASGKVHRDDFWFNPPAKEEDILEWERTNGVTIPESYKEWMRFSNGSGIGGFAAYFYGTKMIGSRSEFVPEGLVVIGELIGDGEFLCFSKETGQLVRYLDGYRDEIDSIDEIVNWLINKTEGEAYSEGVLEREEDKRWNEICVDDEDEDDGEDKFVSTLSDSEKEAVQRSLDLKMITFLESKKSLKEGLPDELIEVLERLKNKYKGDL